MKDDGLYVIHMLECLQQIQVYTQGGHDEFKSASIIQDAVIRKFEIIGEAAKHLSEKLRKAYPNIPWRQIAGFRDVLIHNYFDVDLREVWNIIQNDLPLLKPQLQDVWDNLQGRQSKRPKPTSPKEPTRRKRRR